MKLSVTVLLGIAGRRRSHIHAEETGRVLSAIDPNYVGALSLMLIPGTPLFDDFQSAEFTLIEPDEMLAELRTMIAGTNLSRGLFHANHASNYLPIKARLPKDKAATLKLIDQALAGNIALKPEYLRALYKDEIFFLFHIYHSHHRDVCSRPRPCDPGTHPGSFFDVQRAH